jgi:hypothetical protein
MKQSAAPTLLWRYAVVGRVQTTSNRFLRCVRNPQPVICPPPPSLRREDMKEWTKIASPPPPQTLKGWRRRRNNGPRREERSVLRWGVGEDDAYRRVYVWRGKIQHTTGQSSFAQIPSFNNHVSLMHRRSAGGGDVYLGSTKLPSVLRFKTPLFVPPLPPRRLQSTESLCTQGPPTSPICIVLV